MSLLVATDGAQAARPRLDLDLKTLDSALGSGNWSLAGETCERLEASLQKGKAPRPISAEFLANLEAQCTVAALGQKDSDGASWRWHVAMIFNRRVALETRERWGSSFRPPLVREFGTIGGVRQPAPGADPALEPPKRLSSPGPNVGRLRKGYSKLVLQLVVGIDGRLREPVFVESTNCPELLAFAMLSSLREWTFEPATREGAPVASLYLITLDHRD